MKTIKTFFVLILTCFFFSLNAQTVLDKMADHIGNAIEADYQNGEKWIAFVKGSIPGTPFGGTIMIDMADVAEVTEEGKDGWVTIWANATVGADAIGAIFPASFGFYKRKFDLNTPDSPDFLFNVSGNLEASGFSIASVGIEIDGDYELYADFIQPKVEASIDFSANVGLSINVISLEIKKSVLDQKLNSYLTPGMQIVNYAKNIFNIAMSPSENTWKNFLSGFPRMTTPQDDPNFALTKSIYYDQLIVGQWGHVYVDVRVNVDNYYKQRVWDDNGFLPPKWDWNDVESGPYSISAGVLHTFTYQVKPTNESERFQFWLYEKDVTIAGIDTYRIIEKIEDPNPIYALAEGTDVNGPSIQQILFEGDPNSSIIVVFNESINHYAFNKELISIVGSSSGSLSFEFELSQESRVLTINPNDLFVPGETIALNLSRYIQDVEGNRMNHTYINNLEVSQSSICLDELEPNNSSSQSFSLGTSTSYYNNALCLSAGDEDWFLFSYNSNEYYFKIEGDNALTSGDYGIQFNITGNELNILTEFSTKFTDTKVYLYNSQLNQLAYDDNSNGIFGWITYNLPTEIPSAGPNIVLENTSLNKSFISPGDSFSISGEITNNGDTSTEKAFRVRYYLSDDIYVSGDDDYLDFNIYNTLGAGVTAPLNHDFSTDVDQVDGNYYLLVYVDALEEIEESNEANVFAFPIAIGDVAIPVLLSPQDKAINVAKKPIFSWSAVSGSESYDFAIYVGYTQVFYAGDLQTTNIDPNFNFDYGDNYNWTARATVNGNTGDWAVLSDFEIRPYLNVPFLVSPSNGVTNIELFPTLSWDALDNADYYDIQVSPESDFSPDFDYRNITETSFKIDDDDLQESTLYYWRVRGYSDQGASEYSQIYTFATGGSVVPGAPTIQSPTNGETLTGTTPTITWQQGNGVTHTYQLEISLDASFSSSVYSIDQLDFMELEVPQDVLNEHTLYYIRMRGINSQGYGNYSSIYSFTTGENLSGPGTILWTKKFSKPNITLESTPVFDYQGYLYVNFRDTIPPLGTIHKIDPKSGKTILRIFSGYVHQEDYAEPILSHDGKTLYFVVDNDYPELPTSDYDYLVATNLDGELLWYVDLVLYHGCRKPALDANGNIYVYGEDYSHRDNRPHQDALVSVSPNGLIRWTAKFTNADYSGVVGNPVVSGNKVFIAREETRDDIGKILAINTSNGSTSWTKNLSSDELYENNGGTNLTIAGSSLIFGSNLKKLYSISSSNGNNTSGWPKTLVDRSNGVSVVDENNSIYNGLDEKNLSTKAYVYNSSGTLLWDKEITDDFRPNSVLGDNNNWYFASKTGVVYAVDKASGSEVWTTNLLRNVYAMTIGPDGTLYVTTNTSADSIGLYAIETSATGLLNSNWPVKHHDNQGTGNLNHNPIIYEIPFQTPVVSTTNITNSGFKLSWTEVEEATSYIIDISVDDFSTFLDGYENLELTETELQALSLNEETIYNIRIKSHNEERESNYFKLDVTTINNSAPSGILLLSNEIYENLKSGSLVGEIQINDLDANDIHVIELISGEGDEDNISFEILEDNLISKEEFDFETKNRYSIRLKATDNFGATIETSFFIEILDEFERFDQTISFEPIPMRVYGAGSYDLNISSSSALPVTIVSHNPEVVTIDNGIMTIVSAGQTLISATNDGNEYYNSATKVTKTVIVDKAGQVITMPEIPILSVTDEDYELTAISSSDLDVSYQVENTGIAQITNNNFIQINSAGSTNIIVTQPGNRNFYPADTLIQELKIEKADRRLEVIPNNQSLSIQNTYINTSENAIVTLKSIGQTNVYVSSMIITGTDAAMFTILSPTKNPFDIVSGTSQEIEIKFRPTSTGSKSALLTIINNSTTDTIEIELSGDGISGNTLIEVNPNTNITFGETDINTTAERIINIANVGTTDLDITNFNITGTYTSLFNLVNATPQIIASGQNIEVTVQFTPSTEGTKQAVLEIINDSENASPIKKIIITGIGYNNDIDDDGIINSLDLCPNTPTGVTVDVNGCSNSQHSVDPTITTLSPLNNATDVSGIVDLSIIFSANIQKGTGNILIKDASDDSTIQTIDITSSDVAISGATVTINPPTDLMNGVSYYIQIPNTAFKDSSGNSFMGILDTISWNFTTVKNNETDFTSFSFIQQIGDASINTDAYTIYIEVAYGTDIASLVANFNLSNGAIARVGVINQISGTTANDFTLPLTYTVTAEDGFTNQNWVVNVTINSEQSCTLVYSDDFSGDLSSWTNPTGEGSWSVNTGTLRGDYNITCGSTYCPQADLILNSQYQLQDNWKATQTFTKYTAYNNVEGSSAKFSVYKDASNKFSFYIGATNNWLTVSSIDSVKVSLQYWNGNWQGTVFPSPKQSSTGYVKVSQSWNPRETNTASIRRSGTTYSVYFNDEFLFSFEDIYLNGGGDVGYHTYGGVESKSFLLESCSPLRNTTDFTSYSFTQQTTAATIDTTNHTIDVEVASATDLTSLIATFALSDGAIANVGVTNQVSGTTTNDFTSPVIYTVTAEDGVTAQDWIVTVASSDITAPSLTVLSPLDNATDVDITSNLEITFNEPIAKGTGNILIKDASDDSTIQTIDITSSDVAISGATVTINPPTDLMNGVSYYIQIPNTAFKDSSGNSFMGILDTTSWNFATGISQSQLDDDNDGVSNDLDQCSNTPAGETVDVNGCSQSQLDDDGDGVMNDIDTCSDTPTGETVDSNGCSNNKYIIKIENSNASKWFGGDSRVSFGPRNVGTGQSLFFHDNYKLSSFSVEFTNSFHLENSSQGGTVEIVLQIRNEEGNVLSQFSKLVDETFNGGWVMFNFSNYQYVKANKLYIFTWYLKDGLSNNLESGSAGNLNNPYNEGTGFSSEFKLPNNDTYFDNIENWWDHSWDFCVKVVGSIQLDDDGDGVMNDTDQCPDTPTGETVDATGCTVNIILGDSNGDLNVNVMDLVQDVNYILGRDPTPFVFEAADVNNDTFINVLDIVGTVDIILNPTSVKSVSSQSEWQYYPNNSIGEAVFYWEGDDLYVDSKHAISGMQLAFNKEFNYTIASDITKFDLLDFNKDTTKTLMIYSFTDVSIEPGITKLLTKLKSEAIILEAEKSVVGAPKGLKLTATFKNGEVLGVDSYNQTDSKNLILLSPNPSKGNLNIDLYLLENMDKINIRAYNIQGVLVYSKNNFEINKGKSRAQIDLSKLPNGLYIFVVDVMQNGEIRDRVYKKLILSK